MLAVTFVLFQDLNIKYKMRITKIIVEFCLLLTWHIADAQITFDNYALTGVTIIDANHQTSLSNETVLISHNIISNILLMEVNLYLIHLIFFA